MNIQWRYASAGFTKPAEAYLHFSGLSSFLKRQEYGKVVGYSRGRADPAANHVGLIDDYLVGAGLIPNHAFASFGCTSSR